MGIFRVLILEIFMGGRYENSRDPLNMSENI
jgi:hypothetical protein